MFIRKIIHVEQILSLTILNIVLICKAYFMVTFNKSIIWYSHIVSLIVYADTVNKSINSFFKRLIFLL